MGKSTHFIGHPFYSQVVKLLDNPKFRQISRNNDGERYTKRFDGWGHLAFMLYRNSAFRLFTRDNSIFACRSAQAQSS